MKNINIKNSLILALAALIWGTAFVAQKVGGAVGDFTFNATRSIIGGFVLIPVIIFLDRKKLPSEKKAVDKKRLLLGGVCCGIMLCIASNFQQIGIKYIDSGKSAFITALYMIFVPLIGIFEKKPLTLKIALSVILAVIGMYFLCVTDKFTFGIGEILTLLCAFFFACHILVIDHFAGEFDGVKLSCIQFFTCGILSSVLMFIFEEPSIGSVAAAWLPIAYAGVMSCGVAYTLQIVGQKNMNPTVASIILSLESVFGTLAGIILLGDDFGFKKAIGCALMFAAIILTQLPQRNKQKG